MTSVAAEALVRYGERVFAAIGCDAREAGQVARGLVQANLFGHDSHGIGLAPVYVENWRKQLVVPNRMPRVVLDHGTLVRLDGERGFGRAIGEAAMAFGIERAREHGCAVVGVSNTHHLARIGQWGEQCAAAGMASVHFVNVQSTPLVAPFGGTAARLATNPFCVAVPHDPHPIVLDYATSALALGKVRVALDEGRRMAPDILVDSHGEPTDDPAVMWREPIGAILPFAQHKGYALAIMCEILGGALSGGHVQDRWPRPNPMRNNMLSLIIDAGRMGSAREREEQIARLMAWVRGSPPANGSDGIMLPGEPERRSAALRRREGVPLAEATLEAMERTAVALGVDAGLRSGRMTL